MKSLRYVPLAYEREPWMFKGQDREGEINVNHELIISGQFVSLSHATFSQVEQDLQLLTIKDSRVKLGQFCRLLLSSWDDGRDSHIPSTLRIWVLQSPVCPEYHVTGSGDVVSALLSLRKNQRT